MQSQLKKISIKAFYFFILTFILLSASSASSQADLPWLFGRIRTQRTHRVAARSGRSPAQWSCQRCS